MSLKPTSPYRVFIPPMDLTELIEKFEDREPLRMALEEAMINPQNNSWYLIPDIQKIVLAYLFFPLVGARFRIVENHGPITATRVFTDELQHVTTLSSSFIASYIDRFSSIRQTSLENIGSKACSLENLFVNHVEILNIQAYLNSFPKIRTLALQGTFPADAVIANKDLETLDIFSVENPETAIANVSSECIKLRRVIVHKSHVSKPRLGTIVNRIAENALRSVEFPLAQKILDFVREKAQQWEWKRVDPDAKPFYFEWESNESWPFRFELCMDTSSLISDYHIMINQAGQKRKPDAVNKERRVKRRLEEARLD